MFNVHIDYSFYEKLVEQPKFIETCMCEYILISLRIMNWLFLWASWNVIWKPMASRD